MQRGIPTDHLAFWEISLQCSPLSCCLFYSYVLPLFSSPLHLSLSSPDCSLLSSSVVCLLCMTHFFICCSRINLGLDLQCCSFCLMGRTSLGTCSLIRFVGSPHHFTLVVCEFIIRNIYLEIFSTVLYRFFLPCLKISFIPRKGSL